MGLLVMLRWRGRRKTGKTETIPTLLLVALAFGAVLAACGGEETPTTQPPTIPPSGTPPPAGPSPSPSQPGGTPQPLSPARVSPNTMIAKQREL